MVLLLTHTSWGQRFELVEPSGLVSATVEVGRGRLIVYERSGERIYFSREARYDSADGRFVGYFNFESNRVLRFPRSGSGVLQTADLDDVAPQFRNTIRIARPLGTAPDRSAIADAPPIVSGYTHPPYAAPYTAGYRSAVPGAQSVLIDAETIPNPPLPTARVVLHNSGPREIQVTVVDLKNPRGTRSMRIKPADAAEVQLARDGGSKRIEHYRVVTPDGELITKEFVTEIPPTLRYEVVVHEWAMQSVAIDRTGKSPNVIEDIHFQGRGLGRFHLPPGPQLQSGTIDVYTAARNRGNQGTIRPIVPLGPLPSDTASPLERAVLDAQRAAQGN
jgi:hypothetical protein